MSESDRIAIYLSVFKHAALDVDWKAFAAEQGISTTGNAQRKFKDSLKKDGFQMLNGKIGPVDDTSEDPKKKPRQMKKKQSPTKKRKIEKVEKEEEQLVESSNEVDAMVEHVEESD